MVAAGLTPSPLEGEGWGEGAMGGGASIGLERERPPLPQPLPLREGGEKTAGVAPKKKEPFAYASPKVVFSVLSGGEGLHTVIPTSKPRGVFSLLARGEVPM